VSQPAAAVSAPPPAGTRSYRWLAAPVFAFAFFSLTAGLLAAHDPRSKGYFRLFFSDPVHLKAGFATAAAVLACVQLLTAGWIYRAYPWAKPAWINPLHRWSGRFAFAFTLPVAYHCIFKLGFQDTDSRVLWHSLIGSAFFGAYAAKITIVKLHRFPRPVLPVAGGLLFATLLGLWYTSAVWLYKQDREAKPAPAAVTQPLPAGASAERGKAVFAEAGCSGCHTLASAGATGSVGPNLDQLRPGFDQVKSKVERGGGAMPAFEGQLSAQQIDDVAAFVATTAGR
jgi:mono/diheme cytochrome c family protein